MNRISLCALALTMIGITWVQAAPDDVQFSVVRKRLDMQTVHNAESHSTVTTDDYVYTVTVQSHSFQAINDLQIKYIVFYKDAKAGSEEAPLTMPFTGSKEIPVLRANDSQVFDTNPLKITQNELDGNYHWINGASGRAQSRIVGTWFRAYSQGKLVGEFCNPDTLPNHETWKD